MQKYELTIVLPGDTTEAKQKRVLEKIEKLVSNVSGEVLDGTSWGKKDLFYPIAKQTSGVYYFLNLFLPAEGAPVINREMQIDDEVLRHLLVVGEVNKGASGHMLPKAAAKAKKVSKPRAKK